MPNYQNIILPSFESIPISHELLTNEPTFLADIKKNGTGGLGLDEIIGALQYLLKDVSSICIANNYSVQNLSIIKQLALLDENVNLVLIPYVVNSSHCILLAVNKTLLQIQIFDSDNLQPSLSDIPLLPLLENPYNEYKKVIGQSQYGLQKYDWECGIHVIMTALDLAINIDEITNPNKIVTELDLDAKLQYFWRAAKAQEQINSQQLSFLENNRRQKSAILDIISKIYKENNKDFLKPLLDALQVELWGYDAGEELHRLPNPNDELLLRSFRQFVDHFSKLITQHCPEHVSFCKYIAEHLVPIDFSNKNYTDIVEQRIKQIVIEREKIPDEHIRSKLIEYFNADIVWNHDLEELPNLVIGTEDTKEIAKLIILEDKLKGEFLTVLVNLYKRLLQVHLEELKHKPINSNHQNIDNSIAKKVEMFNQKIIKIKDTFEINDEFAEFLANDPYGIYQLIQVNVKNEDLVRDYTKAELDDIGRICSIAIENQPIDFVVTFFDKNELFEALFEAARIAICTESLSLLKKLIAQGIDSLIDQGRLLRKAVQEENFEATEFLLKKQFPIILDERKQILHLAVGNCNKKILALLLKFHPTIIDLTDEDDASALHLAVTKNFIEGVRTLLSYDADTNLLNKRNESALFYAVRNNNIEIVKLLLTYPETDPNLKLNNGNILHYLVPSNHIDVLKMLLESSIDINMQDDLGFTPLHAFIEQLVFNGHIGSERISLGLPLLKLMLNHPKININLQDQEGFTVLHKLISYFNASTLTLAEKIELIDLILTKKPYLDLKTKYNHTALQLIFKREYWLKKENVLIAERLVRCGADTECLTNHELHVGFVNDLVDAAVLNSNLILLVVIVSAGYFSQIVAVEKLTEILQSGVNPNQMVNYNKHCYNLIHKVLEITDGQLRNSVLNLFLQSKIDINILSPAKMDLLQYFLSLETTRPRNPVKHSDIRDTIRILTEAGLNIDARPYAMSEPRNNYLQYSNYSFLRAKKTSWAGCSARNIAMRKCIDLSGLEGKSFYKLKI